MGTSSNSSSSGSLPDKNSPTSSSHAPISTNNHAARDFALRIQTAENDALIPPARQVNNGDEERYPDKCATYSKGMKQKRLGVVDHTAWKSFKHALKTGDPADFEAMQLGGPRTQNGPQGGLAFDLEGLDASQFYVPPAPAMASDAYATELVEMYWGSLLRDVAFTDYATNPIAAQAAAELSGLSTYAGPREGGVVTPNVLFRGRFPGETLGPYMSQFLLQRVSFGALNLDQRYFILKAGLDFMLDPAEFEQVQNGIDTGKKLTVEPQPKYLHNGRGLASFTHVDVLYQAYFTAYLLLSSIAAPLNPGNPYTHSKTQNGFNTFGQPDIAATLASVASEALKAVWYQKWYVHLRHRPESGGGVVHLIKTGQGSSIDGKLSHLVLDSQAVKKSHSTNNSYLLSQAFPEGSPTHPAYPTGHGTVGGACITALKFFFDGDFVIPSPVVASSDGSQLTNYTGSDAGQLTVNGELHKLASNISFGHGIHAGIHWRSDTDTSIELGEAVALSVLRDRAHTYNEKFSISLKKLDGTVATISNP